MTFQDCYAHFENRKIIIGNSQIERSWELSDYGPCPIAIILKKGTTRNWLQNTTCKPITGPKALKLTNPQWHVRQGPITASGATGLNATLTLAGPDGEVIKYHFSIIPDSPAVMLHIEAPEAAEVDVANTQINNASGIEIDEKIVQTQEITADLCEHWQLSHTHLNLIHYELCDQTDRNNNLCHRKEYKAYSNQEISLRGLLFIVEDVLTKSGLIILKLAPNPDSRPVKCASDLVCRGNELTALGHGIGNEHNGYRWATIGYHGGSPGMTRELHKFQHQLRTYHDGLDGAAISNTWGDRHRDAALCETFIHKELATAEQLTIDICQIDDGWQHGVSINSHKAGNGNGVWEGFYASDPEFWTINQERFPHGLEPLFQAAQSHGINVGLWFAPDSARDFANWQRDADTLMELHHRLGVNFFKIDGVKLRSQVGENRLRRLFERVYEASKGKVIFDLDVTAETRFGYFGCPEFGPLFVENRYSDWHAWWPTNTLRNLWQLCHVLAPSRLRMEVLNPLRNQEKYNGDPLAPSNYPADWIFASVMVASPLFWCELSNLEAKTVAELGNIIPIWKKYRKVLHTGNVIPLGNCPDGTTMSGFLIEPENKETPAHLLVFRDICCTEDVFKIQWESTKIQHLAGTGEASINNSEVTITLPAGASYGWFSM